MLLIVPLDDFDYLPHFQLPSSKIKQDKILAKAKQYSNLGWTIYGTLDGQPVLQFNLDRFFPVFKGVIYSPEIDVCYFCTEEAQEVLNKSLFKYEKPCCGILDQALNCFCDHNSGAFPNEILVLGEAAIDRAWAQNASKSLAIEFNFLTIMVREVKIRTMTNKKQQEKQELIDTLFTLLYAKKIPEKELKLLTHFLWKRTLLKDLMLQGDKKYKPKGYYLLKFIALPPKRRRQIIKEDFWLIPLLPRDVKLLLGKSKIPDSFKKEAVGSRTANFSGRTVDFDVYGLFDTLKEAGVTFPKVPKKNDLVLGGKKRFCDDDVVLGGKKAKKIMFKPRQL